MDFIELLEEHPFSGTGKSFNPYAAKNKIGDWLEGTISIKYLNVNFGQYETAEEMKNATDSEGLKLYFDWLKEQGILN